MKPFAPLLTALLVISLGGALVSPYILTIGTGLLAAGGLFLMAKKHPIRSGWEIPKELRLLHFAFWFFVVVSTYSWAREGFDAETFRTWITQAGLILFWPLVMALTCADFRAKSVFIALGAMSAVVTILFAVGLVTDGPTGKIALLSGTLALAGSCFLFTEKHHLLASVFLVSGAAAVTASLFTGTPGVSFALPLLLALLLPLVTGPFRFVVLALIVAALGVALALDCCSATVINAVIDQGQALGFAGLLGWAFLILIPLVTFARQLSSRHQPTVALAVAGTMVATGYLLFGLTSATFQGAPMAGFYLLTLAAISASFFRELDLSCFLDRKVKVTATVITKNEEAHIADCLQSARQVADEIVVLDSGSTDRTVDIARQYADVVEVTDWPGFGIQKQRALEKATGDWVLSIDADERVTPGLAREINHHLADPDADAYKLPWAVTLYGTRLDFGRSGRAPLRLFRREGVRFSDAMVHEKILIPEGRTVKTLRGRLTHYTHRDFGHALEKSAKYAWLGSQEKYRKGKTTRTLLYPTFRGLMTFIQVYFIRFGFLDGPVGFLVAVTYSQGSFNKYAGLWTLRRTEKRKARE
ncbi:MAG: glycosyltransferase family 2 protein [Marinobacter sp.]|nr:glycosyltransferase family 2 protein [Marinobacter sp.]